jgi:archaemetzincin
LIVPPEHIVIISPIGSFEPDLFGEICSEVQRLYTCRTEIISLLESVDFSLDPGRNQHHSTLILEKLAGMAPSRAIKVLAVTTVDLFIPVLTHVFGEAQLGGKACIISTHRLKEGLNPVSAPETYLLRVVKEAIHELGHTFKLRHCRDSGCIMHYSRTVRDVDRKSDQFCRYCKVLLEDEMKRLAEINPPLLRRR